MHDSVTYHMQQEISTARLSAFNNRPDQLYIKKPVYHGVRYETIRNSTNPPALSTETKARNSCSQNHEHSRGSVLAKQS